MGKIYYDMGFLEGARVVECSATDLIGQYVGQTGPKVQKKFDDARGAVLFIDEAYRLAGEHFAKEAMDEIVDCLTKERYQNRLVVSKCMQRFVSAFLPIIPRRVPCRTCIFEQAYQLTTNTPNPFSLIDKY